ncbi:polyprotein [Drepanopeziza brunnea f. sp. 'multigermtubi' MB_m1]|uniref:Polyprotein n=1 Tax=Marssonina brunnea f. sp. multigermtubi (strain MB_m1) TaxID=1072389 RepID=K1WR82_MARBU|nr:polyprotein [Drepanopeziza brunnea f. sp. 'multigermtubi' MB_m1]EKD14907.1 polyprotein [Drepanopeziza brunnea f. sp. 'multigermtubi' MB_m1]
MPGLNIVGFVTDSEGRHAQKAKIEKILEWTRCDDITEACAFIGIAMYSRIWIKNFSTIAASIYATMKKGVKMESQQKAMQLLKEALLSAPALIKVDYGPEEDKIILTVDACLRSSIRMGTSMSATDAPSTKDKQRSPATGKVAVNNQSHVFDAEAIGAWKALEHAIRSTPSYID